jgi:hypothetical protein
MPFLGLICRLFNNAVSIETLDEIEILLIGKDLKVPSQTDWEKP